MFGRFVHLTLVSLFASVALVPTTSAQMLDETPARLEALAVRAAAAETDAQFEIESQEAEQEDVPSRLLGTTTHQALIADSAFLSARNAYKNNHKKALDELSQQVKGYPLAGYVELWQLLLRTKNNPNDSSVLSDMRRFIAAHEGEYLGERARGEAARVAALAGDIATFNAFWAKLTWQKTEPDLRCFRALMTLKRQPTNEALDAAKKELATTSMIQDTSCRRLADETLARSPKWAWSYLLILLQRNRLSMATDFLSSPFAKTILQAKDLAPVISKPKVWYTKNKKRLARVPATRLAVAALRLAATDTDAAAQVASVAAKRLGPMTRTLVWGRIGYLAALNHDPKALSYYARAGNTLKDHPLLINKEAVLSWHVRAALHVTDWHKTLKGIEAMPASLQSQPAWQYWKARALSATGKKTAAKKLYQSLTKNNSFYGLLACDALHVAYPAGQKTYSPPLTEEKKVAFAADASLQRALRFYDLNLFYEGNREWSWAMRTMGKTERLALAEYALGIGLTHRAINTSATTGALIRSHLYPQAHADQVRQAAQLSGLPEEWLFGLIRQESRFIAGAKSSVGALGLMQVMPRTARWVAKKIALENYRDGQLTRLDTNLMIGSQYLKLIYDNFEGSVPLGCASYNAGPSRAILWRSRLTKPVDGAVFVETIPFTETREYVKHVATNTAQYMYSTADQKRLTQILGKITPKPLSESKLP